MYEETRNPFFNVRKESLMTQTGIALPNKFALINEENNYPLGVVSPDYELVHNHTINGLFQDAIEGLHVDKVIDHLDNNMTRWKRWFIIDDPIVTHEITNNDVVGLLLEVHNGFTGRVSFGYKIMGFRYICENGLITGKETFMMENFAHYVNNPARLRESFSMKFNAFKENAGIWREWTKIPFDQEKFAGFIDYHAKPVGDSNIKPKTWEYIPPRVATSIKDSYEPIVNTQKLQPNMWGAFNVLTHIATHETKARNGSNVFGRRYGTVNRLAADLYNYKEAA